MVNEKHPLLKRGRDIEAMMPYWDQVDTIVEGYHAIKARGVDFLPRFPDENSQDYENRLNLTKFTNIYRDTLEGLATKPFEEEISLVKGDGEEIPAEALEFIENVDGAGNNITMFSALTFFEGINDAISWIFVDYPTVKTTAPLSVAEAKAKKLKPFWSHVIARNVLEVRTQMYGSEEMLSYIRLLEPETDAAPEHVREMFRDDEGVVTWKLWQKNNTPGIELMQQFVLVDEGTLSINVIPLIPFITGRRDGRTFKLYPVMRDAADLQIDLYQDESALKFIKTLAGYPMLAANGLKPEKGPDGQPKKVATGPMRVLFGLPDGHGGHGEWKYIEPNANSMEFLQKSIDKTKQDLRELGRQPLTSLSSQLTNTTTAIAAGKAKSAVSAWALGLKDALENALKLTMQYMGLKYEPLVNVYTGFDNVMDTGKDEETLLKARENGDISQETFLAELKRRKVLSPEFNFEDEKKKLLDDIPVDDSVIDQEIPSDAQT